MSRVMMMICRWSSGVEFCIDAEIVRIVLPDWTPSAMADCIKLLGPELATFSYIGDRVQSAQTKQLIIITLGHNSPATKKKPVAKQ